MHVSQGGDVFTGYGDKPCDKNSVPLDDILLLAIIMVSPS
jgi:hypothetical protein